MYRRQIQCNDINFVIGNLVKSLIVIENLIKS